MRKGTLIGLSGGLRLSQGGSKIWLYRATMKKRNRAGAKKKPKSISKLIKECDKAFSLIVRQKNASKHGEVYCFTCNHPMFWRKSQCGHFISRYYKSVRWDEDNCRVQCFMCNIAKRGDPVTFRENLVEEIGEKRVLQLEARRNLSVKLTREKLELLLSTLQQNESTHGIEGYIG